MEKAAALKMEIPFRQPKKRTPADECKIRKLIIRMKRENLRWDSTRISECLKA